MSDSDDDTEFEMDGRAIEVPADLDELTDAELATKLEEVSDMYAEAAGGVGEAPLAPLHSINSALVAELAYRSLDFDEEGSVRSSLAEELRSHGVTK